MRVIIFGVGALGTLFGSRLNGLADVVLVGKWREQIEVIGRDGLTVQELDGRFTHHRLNITNRLPRISSVDLILVLVKGQQTAVVAAKIKPLLTSDTLVMTLQNGLGNLEMLREQLACGCVVQGVTAQGATVTAVGQTRHAGNGLTYLAATAPQTERLAKIVALFNEAGIVTHIVANQDSLVWGKLAANAAINPLTALLGVPNGALVANAVWQRVLVAAAQEVAEVADALGIALPYADAGEYVREVCRATAVNHSSMLQDLRRGATTEIDAISGKIVAYGEQYQVATPVNWHLRQWVVEMQDGRLGRETAVGLIEALVQKIGES